MIRRRGLRLAIVLALVLSSPTMGNSGPENHAVSFLVDQLGGDADDWILSSESWGPDPVRGKKVWWAKFLNLKTFAMVGVIADARGHVIGFDDFEKRRAAALAALPPFERKADPALRKYLAEAEAGATGHQTTALSIFVVADTTAAVDAVFLRHPEIDRIGDEPLSTDALLGPQADLIEAELRTAKAEVFALAEAAQAAELEALGAKIVYQSSSVPLLFAEVPTDRLRAVAKSPEVTDMGLEGTWHESMNVAGPTVQADWTTTTADQGSGVKVGVIEYRSVHATGDLVGKVWGWYNAASNLTGSANACYGTRFDHATWVAGAIASQSATYRGVAPGARILSAATCGTTETTNDQRVIEAADWALQQGADILNLSLVQDTTTGRETARKYFDSVIDEQLDNVVAATGNLNDCGTADDTLYEEVGSPGVGWNVLTVGGIDDQNTTSRGDNRLWYWPTIDEGACWADREGTAWNNGTDPDFNKPEVSAPAVNVRTANGLVASGTSVATPIVAGIAAQLMGRSATAKVNPNLTKALIMAGAVFRAPLPQPAPAPVYSTDHQGIGVVSAKWANKALIAEGGATGGYHTGTFTTVTTYTKTFSVTSGQYAQVALVWNTQTSGSNKAKVDTYTTDLDMVVTLPGGTRKISDSTWNGWEYVGFTAPSTGTVTVRVTVYRLGTASQGYALAWIKGTTPL